MQERALKGYERDLEQEQARRQRSEMIRKYHFVRFLGQFSSSFSSLEITGGYRADGWVDRKTATKQLRSAQRQYEKAKQQQDQTSDKLAALQEKIDAAQIDVNYTIYYPLTEKYLSLYPQEKKREVVDGHNQKVASTDDGEEESGDEDTQTSGDDKIAENEVEKPPMWDVIKKCMANKTLDKLRDGKLNIGFDGKPIQNLEGTALSNVGKDTGKEKAETTTANKEKKRKRKEIEVEQPKEEEGDSDGGFFEE